MKSRIFEWDARKAYSNFNKHGVTYDEAASVFNDDFAITLTDPTHFSEERFVTVGLSSKLRALLVVHGERKDAIRIISARKATASERSDYEEQFG